LGCRGDRARRAADEKGWWKDKIGFARTTGQQLVVVQTVNSTPDNLRSLGREIERWQAGFLQARYIWGLDDLLIGLYPRTPPIYLSAPYSLDRFDEFHEPVVLVYNKLTLFGIAQSHFRFLRAMSRPPVSQLV
jgi:hypothetical protein